MLFHHGLENSAVLLPRIACFETWLYSVRQQMPLYGNIYIMSLFLELLAMARVESGNLPILY